ncbi:serine/threonine-protein kinase [Fimbriiglobus ruber]|uniref:Serine/threonine protein kinase n=1 Tax=Fimbriiglobus ruber TaxID=1908690 RepID=A0A225E0A1_9BACT|nr:serine/threonine-protein kinase [Fimbriiglobus ruber]OWK46653.1 Serine/threonine protein kinase [Fimbriiglobus ruber]
MNLSGSPAPPSSFVDRLADEMMTRWRAGGRLRTEDFLDRHPDLWHRPDAALELIAEELALRTEGGEDVAAEELVARFPAWAAQVTALLDCQRVLGPPAAPRFPVPGDMLGEFRLVAELGRGVHGRVFLATQSGLADRPVVLKLGPDAGNEHLSLARLQHTHIVPLYSAHEFPAAGLRALCMPYFGGATLAELLTATAKREPLGRSGALLLAALAAAPAPAGIPVPQPGPACALLGRASFVEAVCWIGACLADALQYAHDRGLLHLDLKPSNVLLAADGVPMLLDFHLARPPLRAGESAPTWIGGTPGYMPGEQLAALDAVRTGDPVPGAVDARADVYALGVLLTEALRYQGPADDGEIVSVGLADVLAHCTETDAARRYPTAAELAADLRRHMADLPLRGVRNRSFHERWRKWRRRRPYALSLVLAVAATAAIGSGVTLHAQRQVGRARTALEEGESFLRQGRLAEAAEAFRGTEALAQGVPFQYDLTARVKAGKRATERGLAVTELHALCERVRPMYAAEVLAPDEARKVAELCRAVWAERESVVRNLEGQASADLEQQWRADLLDLGIMTAYLDASLAAPDSKTDDRRRALETLAQAESLLGASGVLYLERANHARALGLMDMAAEADRLAQAARPRTAWEHLAVGRAKLGAGDAKGAAADLDSAIALDPRSLWANYYQGVCCLRLGDPTGALSAFSACVAIAPQSAWCYFNRGLAQTELGRQPQARADFDRATALDRTLTTALLDRSRYAPKK